MIRTKHVDFDTEELVKDLRDKIQNYEPLIKRKLGRLSEEALIRRAYTMLTCIEMASRDYEEEIRDLEDSLREAEDEAGELGWQLEKAQDEVAELRLKLASLQERTNA
jgi:chromosome segregation ATPase